MAAAEAWARERGCQEMRLTSGVHRPEAHQFYRRLGYTELKQQLVFTRSLTEDE